MSRESRALSAAQAIEYARFTTGGAGGDWPSAVDPLGLVNEAGEYLVSAHDWTWTTSRIVTLGTTAGQDYVALPDDFGGDIAEEAINGLGLRRLKKASTSTLLSLKTSPLSDIDGQGYFFALSYAVDPEGGEPRPRILLYPTPQSDVEEAFQVVYNARWQNVGEASDLLVLPSYCVSLYLEILQHITRGRLEEDQGSVAARLQGLMASDLFKAAKRQDAAMQTSLGRMTHTHTFPGAGTSNYAWPYNYSFVQVPS